MLSLIASVAMMATTAPKLEVSDPPPREPTEVYVVADPADFALPALRPRQPNNVWRWVRLRDPAFDDRFAFAEMWGFYDGLLVELTQSCRELFRSSGAVPLRKQAQFRINGQLCFVKDIYMVPDEDAARALAVNIQVRAAREDGEDWPEDPAEAADAYLASFKSD